MEVEPEARRFGSLGSIVHLLLLTWAAVLAAGPLRDNSFLTHLATGRIILDDWSVPRVDPYSFTAPGAEWTVQSWLPSVAYAAAERLAGQVGLHALVLIVMVVAMSLLWRLTQPAESLLARVVVVGLALAVVSSLWVERPYMIGVIGLSVVWLALEGRVPTWTLGPMLVVWVNSHGSFPLAFALVALVGAGRWMDGREVTGGAGRLGWREAVPLGVLRWMAVGTVLGALQPLGPRLLAFPFMALTESRSFEAIAEWRAPDYEVASEMMFLVLLAAAVVAVVRMGSWARVLPVLAFGLAAVYAQRNIVFAVVVLVPVVSEALPAWGSLRSTSRPATGPALAVACTGLLALAVGVAVSSDTGSLDPYPGRALAWIDANVSEEDRVATQDFVGNAVTVLDGPSGRVFFDDRADMYPEAMIDDYLVLLRGRPGWDEVLDRRDVDHVLWERSSPLAGLLVLSGDWQVAFTDGRWLVASRRT